MVHSMNFQCIQIIDSVLELDKVFLLLRYFLVSNGTLSRITDLRGKPLHLLRYFHSLFYSVEQDELPKPDPNVWSGNCEM